MLNNLLKDAMFPKRQLSLEKHHNCLICLSTHSISIQIIRLQISSELSPFQHWLTYLLRYLEYSASPCLTEFADNGDLAADAIGFTLDTNSCGRLEVLVIKAGLNPETEINIYVKSTESRKRQQKIKQIWKKKQPKTKTKQFAENFSLYFYISCQYFI